MKAAASVTVRSPGAGLALLATAFYACFLFGARFGGTPLAPVVLALFCLACAGVLAVELGKESFDPFSPIVYLTGFFLVEFVIRNAIYLHDGELPIFYGDPIDRGKYLFALAVGLASYLVLLAGYYCPGVPRAVARALPSMCRRTDVSPWAFLPVMLAVFALGLLGWKSRVDAFGGPGNYVATFMQHKWVLGEDPQQTALSVLWTHARDAMNVVVPLGYVFLFRGSRSRFLKGAWLACFAATVALAVLTGFRNTVLMTIMGIVLLHHYLVRPFTKRTVAVLFAAIVLAVGALTWLQSVLYVVTWNWEPQGISYAVRGVVGQGSSFDALWGICSTFPDRVPYLKGSTFVDMLTAAVPRILWAAKKEIYGIGEITMLMGMPTHFQQSVSMPGELFANFGRFGIAGMFVYGVLFRAVDEKKNGDAGWAMSYSVFLSARWLAVFWMGFTGLVTTAYTLAILFVVLRLVDLLPRASGAPAATGGPPGGAA